MLHSHFRPDQTCPTPMSLARRVDDRKDAERQAHVQRREEEAARPGRGQVDPFPRNVQRCVSTRGEAEDQSRVQAPTVPADLNGMHVFYSAAALEVLLDKLRAALVDMADKPLVTLKQKSAKVGTGCGGRWFRSFERSIGCRVLRQWFWSFSKRNLHVCARPLHSILRAVFEYQVTIRLFCVVV